MLNFIADSPAAIGIGGTDDAHRDGGDVRAAPPIPHEADLADCRAQGRNRSTRQRRSVVTTRGFKSSRSRDDPSRVPPGQYVTNDFPVLSAGPTPRTPLDAWSFALRDVYRKELATVLSASRAGRRETLSSCGASCTCNSAAMSCCRRSAFSATSSTRRRTRSAANPETNRRRSITRRVLHRLRADGIRSQDGCRRGTRGLECRLAGV